MTLQNLISIVISSHPNDWNRINCDAGGPCYCDRFHSAETESGQSYLTVTSHSDIAIFMPHLSISLAFGYEWRQDFKEHWANKFLEPFASGCFLDLLYSGVLVFRTHYVSVDGGRAYLPLPRSSDQLIVPANYAQLICLLDHLRGISDFERYFKQAGFTMSDEPWPTWK